MADQGRGVKDGVTPARALAVAGVVALLSVGVASIAMVAGEVGGDGERSRPAPRAGTTPTATPTPDPTPEPEPTPRPLSDRQRAERRAAAETVRSRGFTVVRLRDYQPRHTLRVLIGRDASGGRLAFFFADDAYIGNDTSEPSAELRVRRRSDRRVTLAYGIFAPGDEPCCPSGGPVRVRFRLTASALSPMDPLPPPQQRSSAYQPA